MSIIIDESNEKIMGLIVGYLLLGILILAFVFISKFINI